MQSWPLSQRAISDLTSTGRPDSRLFRLRISPTLAHVLPLAAYMALGALTGLFQVKNPLLPWWRHAPEQWIYPLQTVVVGLLIYACRAHYTFRPVRGLGLAALLGSVGIALWFAPSLCYPKLVAAGLHEASWWKWLGLTPRDEGFDPTFFRDQRFWYIAALTMRFVRMVIVVPLMEEIFWRSFLTRYLQADGRPFQRVPFGKHTWPAFFIVTIAVVVIHMPEDYVGAAMWGPLVYWLSVRTKSLAACVFMHAVANLLLGIYVVQTQHWGFW